MTKFRVDVHGKNYSLDVMRKRFFFLRTFEKRAVGFYTTRFIEAETANDAIETVFSLLRSELCNAGRQTEHSNLELKAIQEDEVGFDRNAPGGGFTFYDQSSSE